MKEAHPMTPAKLIADGVSAVPARNLTFKPWPYEQLLNEAGAIAEKCLDLKGLLDRLYVENANLSLQILADSFGADLDALEAAADPDQARLEDAQREKDGITNFTFANGISDIGYGDSSTLRTSVRDLVSLVKPMMDDGQLVHMNSETRGARVTATQAGIASIGLAERISSANKRQEFARKAISRNTKQRAIALAMRQQRASLVAAGGPLDYNSKIQSLLAGLLIPYLIELRERCVAIQQAFECILGIVSDDLPPVDTEYVENFHKWIRAQAILASKFVHYDQLFTVVISLTQLGLRVVPGTPIIFSISGDLTAGHGHCRIRGASAVVETSNPMDLFRAKLTPPRSAYFDIEGNALPLLADDQVTDPILLGRIGSRRLVHDPQVNTSSALVNISPFGRTGENSWTLVVDNVTLGNSEIQDFQIEILMLGRAAQP